MNTPWSLRRLVERTIAESGPDNLDVAVWRVMQAVKEKVKGNRSEARERRKMLLQSIEHEVEATLLQGGFWRDDRGFWRKPKSV
jgi:hypothetical protein